jgi:hypothetical protein
MEYFSHDYITFIDLNALLPGESRKIDMTTLIYKEIEDYVFLSNMTPKKVLRGLTLLEFLMASVLHLLFESSNSLFQAAKNRARDYRNNETFISMKYISRRNLISRHCDQIYRVPTP